jgi:hypothetical protein
LIKQARKAGERGPVSVTLPDGTSITSALDGAVEQMTETSGNGLDAWMAKHAHQT